MNEKNIALLIDADNVSAKYVKSIFDELASYGMVSIRRIYGNWKKTYEWSRELLLEYSIQPIQQFDYTKGKNATDMAMVIDAMDLLYSNKVDIFCIVTSDSDFTRLAMRLRESQAYVIGMGESKTPLALTKACNRFVHLNLITYDEPKEDKLVEYTDKDTKSDESNVTPIDKIQEAIMNMIYDTDVLTLGAVGSSLSKLFTDFDVRNYGYTKLNIFLREECNKINISEQEGTFVVTMKSEIDINTVRREIIDMVSQSKDGKGLPILLEALKARHKNFNYKDYGFSKFSSFLKSIDKVVVDNNKVELRNTKNEEDRLGGEILQGNKKVTRKKKVKRTTQEK